MSLVMFASVGLAPLSLAGAGALVGHGFGLLFACAAALMVLVMLLVVASRGLRGLDGATAAA
jgi:hypothetical protein